MIWGYKVLFQGGSLTWPAENCQDGFSSQGSPQSALRVLLTWHLASFRENDLRGQGRGCNSLYDLTLESHTVIITIVYWSHRPALIQCAKRPTQGMDSRGGDMRPQQRLAATELTHWGSLLKWPGPFFCLFVSSSYCSFSLLQYLFLSLVSPP